MEHGAAEVASRAWMVEQRTRELRKAAYEDGKVHGRRGSLLDPKAEAHPFEREWERGYREGLRTHKRSDVVAAVKAHGDKTGYLGGPVTPRVVPAPVRSVWLKARRDAARQFQREAASA